MKEKWGKGGGGKWEKCVCVWGGCSSYYGRKKWFKGFIPLVEFRPVQSPSITITIWEYRPSGGIHFADFFFSYFIYFLSLFIFRVVEKFIPGSFFYFLFLFSMPHKQKEGMMRGKTDGEVGREDILPLRIFL